MKTSERWCPSHTVPFFLAQRPSKTHYIPWYDIMWHHDITVWHQMTSYVIKVNLNGPIHQKKPFQHGNLDLWPWPSSSSEISLLYTPPPNLVGTANVDMTNGLIKSQPMIQIIKYPSHCGVITGCRRVPVFGLEKIGVQCSCWTTLETKNSGSSIPSWIITAGFILVFQWNRNSSAG